MTKRKRTKTTSPTARTKLDFELNQLNTHPYILPGSLLMFRSLSRFKHYLERLGHGGWRYPHTHRNTRAHELILAYRNRAICIASVEAHEEPNRREIAEFKHRGLHAPKIVYVLRPKSVRYLS